MNQLAVAFLICTSILILLVGGAYAATINVPTEKATIQDAVDAASAGDTIIVASGTYEECVTIDKTLNLTAPDGATILCPAVPEDISLKETSAKYEYLIGFFGGTYNASNDTLHADGTISITMEGFTLDANDFKPTGRWASVLCRNVNSDAGDSLIQNNDLTNIFNNETFGKETFGILGYGDMNITVRENTIYQFERGGIGMYSGDNRVISNIVRGPCVDGNYTTWAPNGIQFGYGAKGLIQDNEVCYCGWPGTDWSGTGIMVVDTSNVTVDHNYVHDNEVAMSVLDFPEAAYGSAWAGACSNVIVTNNLIRDNEWGLDISNEIDNVTVENNDIFNNLCDGISVSDYEQYFTNVIIPDPTNVSIHYNNIFGNGDTGLYVGDNVYETVNATDNWWGDATGPNTTTNTAMGDNVSDNAIIDPWLTGSLMRTYQVDAGDSIQAAIDRAKAGDTIIVAPGIYTENIVVNKPVRLIGAGSGEDPLSDTILRKLTNERIVQLTASGNSELDPLLLQDMRIEPDGVYGIEVPADEVSFVEMDNVVVIGAADHSTESEVGLKVAQGASLTHLKVADCAFDRCDHGWYFAKKWDGTDTSNVQFVTVSDTTFNDNDFKALYAEKLSDASFTGVTVNNNGGADYWNQVWNGGFDLNLKAGDYKDLSFTDMTVMNNGLGYKEGAGMMIKARDDGSYTAYPATLDNVTITNGQFCNNERGIRIGEPGKSNVGPTNVTIFNANISGNVQTYTGSDGSEYGGVVNQAVATVDARYTYWGDNTGPYNAATNPEGLGDAVSDNVEYDPVSDGDWNPWNDVYSQGSPDGTYVTIGELIEAYNCYVDKQPAPLTGETVSIGKLIAVYNAYTDKTPM